MAQVITRIIHLQIQDCYIVNHLKSSHEESDIKSTGLQTFFDFFIFFNGRSTLNLYFNTAFINTSLIESMSFPSSKHSFIN